MISPLLSHNVPAFPNVRVEGPNKVHTKWTEYQIPTISTLYLAYNKITINFTFCNKSPILYICIFYNEALLVFLKHRSDRKKLYLKSGVARECIKGALTNENDVSFILSV
jgi:hypothetical protein